MVDLHQLLDLSWVWEVLVVVEAIMAVQIIIVDALDHLDLYPYIIIKDPNQHQE